MSGRIVDLSASREESDLRLDAFVDALLDERSSSVFFNLSASNDIRLLGDVSSSVAVYDRTVSRSCGGTLTIAGDAAAPNGIMTESPLLSSALLPRKPTELSCQYTRQTLFTVSKHASFGELTRFAQQVGVGRHIRLLIEHRVIHDHVVVFSTRVGDNVVV